MRGAGCGERKQVIYLEIGCPESCRPFPCSPLSGTRGRVCFKAKELDVTSCGGDRAVKYNALAGSEYVSLSQLWLPVQPADIGAGIMCVALGRRATP